MLTSGSVGKPRLEAPDLLIRHKHLVGREQSGYVADPFFLPTDRTRILCEVRTFPDKKEIALLSVDGKGAVLEAILSLDSNYWWAFPYVFQDAETMYMLPSRNLARGPAAGLQLFSLDDDKISLVSQLNIKEVDPVIFRHENNWFLLCGKNTRASRMRAYTSSELFGEWHEVPFRTPIGVRRVGGRPYQQGQDWIIPCQRYWRNYGFAVSEYVLQVSDLGVSMKRQTGLTDLSGTRVSQDWNACGMHTLDVRDGWSVTDGRARWPNDEWSIGLYRRDLRGSRMGRREPLTRSRCRRS
jgi:hypothetical protein